LKIVYDLLLFLAFRALKPPEEDVQNEGVSLSEATMSRFPPGRL
jgi:hypothetical protein